MSAQGEAAQGEGQVEGFLDGEGPEDVPVAGEVPGAALISVQVHEDGGEDGAR